MRSMVVWGLGGVALLVGACAAQPPAADVTRVENVVVTPSTPEAGAIADAAAVAENQENDDADGQSPFASIRVPDGDGGLVAMFGSNGEAYDFGFNTYDGGLRLGGLGGSIGLGSGNGRGVGSRGDAGKKPPPTLREGALQVNGRLPPEVIQRVARQTFLRLRLCYENGLKANPKLEGTVTTTFVIDAAGGVSSVADGGSTMPDKGVVQCVVRGFAGLTYPQPESGSVTVVFPILFKPGR